MFLWLWNSEFYKKEELEEKHCEAPNKKIVLILVRVKFL